LGTITRMNVFTTDHPLVSQHWRPSTKKERWSLYCSRVLTVTLILCPLFLAVTWVGMCMPETPDVPEPSAAPSLLDLILAATGFMISFPAYLFAQVDEPFGLAEKIWVYGGVTFDGLFWAFTSVSLHQFLAWHFRKKPFDT
jgi:hypothetical protein